MQYILSHFSTSTVATIFFYRPFPILKLHNCCNMPLTLADILMLLGDNASSSVKWEIRLIIGMQSYCFANAVNTKFLWHMQLLDHWRRDTWYPSEHCTINYAWANLIRKYFNIETWKWNNLILNKTTSLAKMLLNGKNLSTLFFYMFHQTFTPRYGKRW